MGGQLQRRPVRTTAPIIRRGNQFDKVVQSGTTFIRHLIHQLLLTLGATLLKHSGTKLEGQSKAVAKLLGASSDDEDSESQKRLYNNNHYNNGNYPSQEWASYGNQREFPVSRSRY